LRHLYTETVAGLGVAVLLAEENKTKWAPTIGYFVVLELRVALSLAAEQYQMCDTAYKSADRVENSQPRGLKWACYSQYTITTCHVENSPSLIGWLREMRRGFGIL
jgi:hypothetical protein